jgi:hypothetical protein
LLTTIYSHKPSLFRSNKSLPCQFTVLVLYPIPDGTKVTISAGNEENSYADIKNNATEMTAQMARFSDLRFVGKSGRGKNFNLTITIHTSPLKEVATVNGIIKVTVDGPRDSRNPNKHLMPDPRKRCGGPLDASAFAFLAKQPRFLPPPGFPAAFNQLPPLLPARSVALYESFIAAAAMNAALRGGQASNVLPFNSPADFLAAQQQISNALLGLKKIGENVGKEKKEDQKLPSSSELPSPKFTPRATEKIKVSEVFEKFCGKRRKKLSKKFLDEFSFPKF